MMKRQVHPTVSVCGSIRCAFFVVALIAQPLAARTKSANSESSSEPFKVSADDTTYHPSPENLAARKWFEDAKFGIFIHWGDYSVLGRGEWAMENERIPLNKYETFASQFNPTKFDARKWVSLFKNSGAKYITFTAKHHDGFGMWDSKVSDWDIVDRTPYGRDVLKQLADECHRQGMKIFFYYSLLDWHHPDYYPRGRTGHSTGRPDHGDWNKYLDYMNAQLAELLNGRYGQIRGIWFDGWWDQQLTRTPSHENAEPKITQIDWHLRRTYDMIHRMQPACLIGNNHHVAPFPGEDFQMFERDLPGQNKAGLSGQAKIGKLPLETCDTINHSWGYNSRDKEYKSVPELIRYLVRAAGQNANLLLNIGPRPDGTIDPEMSRRLEGIGKWMTKYAHTIRGTRGGPIRPQAWGASTQTDDAIYLHILDQPSADKNNWLTLAGTSSLMAKTAVRESDSASIALRRDPSGQLQVKLGKHPDQVDIVLRISKTNER
ncbi:MAG TPA: alpha-L-fucosidase [Lacipirellulaceae bacterium]|nr:alpha-L-fucosidase [Lacipirellulaceae bacterium]